MDWPTQTPELNPIKNLWSYFEYMIAERLITTKYLMMEFINKAWDEISKDEELLHSLAESMSRRIQAVIDAHVDPTEH